MGKREKASRPALPEKMVRIEYEIPPMRAIWSVWYEDFEGVTDDEYREALCEDHPRARVRKIYRGISPEQARAISFHDSDDDEEVRKPAKRRKA